jgi:hypothetical protein
MADVYLQLTTFPEQHIGKKIKPFVIKVIVYVRSLSNKLLTFITFEIASSIVYVKFSI